MADPGFPLTSKRDTVSLCYVSKPNDHPVKIELSRCHASKYPRPEKEELATTRRPAIPLSTFDDLIGVRLIRPRRERESI